MLVQLTVTTCTNFAGRLSLQMLGKRNAEGKRRRRIILVTEVSCGNSNQQSVVSSQQRRISLLFPAPELLDAELSCTAGAFQHFIQRAGQAFDAAFVVG